MRHSLYFVARTRLDLHNVTGTRLNLHNVTGSARAGRVAWVWATLRP